MSDPVHPLEIELQELRKIKCGINPKMSSYKRLDEREAELLMLIGYPPGTRTMQCDKYKKA